MRKRFQRLPFMFTPQALLYPPVLAAALLFAQGVKMPISYTVFLFVLLLPAASLIQLAVARFTVRVNFRVSAATTQKFAPILLNAVIKNRGPFPFSPIEVVLTIPTKDGTHTEDARFILSLMPMSSCTVEQSIIFAFRGEYKVGIDCIYIYDFMHTMRIRIPLDMSADIFVSPRVVEPVLSDNETAGTSDVPHSLRAPRFSGTEFSDIRTYTNGDSRKHIHWKLSTKSDELLVKDFASQNENAVAIFCDFEPVTASSLRTVRAEYTDTADLYCADWVVETAIAAVRRELAEGNTVILGWFESGLPVFATLHPQNKTVSFYKRFASAVTDSTAKQILRLSMESVHRPVSRLIIVSPTADGEYAEDYIRSAKSVEISCPTELYLCTSPALFEASADTDKEYDGQAKLQASGIRVTIPKNATLQ